MPLSDLIRLIEKNNLTSFTNANSKTELKTEIPNSKLGIYQSSIAGKSNITYFLANLDEQKVLVSLSVPNLESPFSGENKEITIGKQKYKIKICQLTHENAEKLRQLFPYVAPTVIPVNNASFGLGDRIGGIAAATPGHIMVASNYDIIAFFAQQSVRENTRTGRNWNNVLDDVSWAVFQSGFKKPWGADANHLISDEDIIAGVNAGYTLFSIDVLKYIPSQVSSLSKDKLKEAFDSLFSKSGEKEKMLTKYTRKPVKAGNLQFSFSQEELMQTVVKYLPMIRRAIVAYNLIKSLKKNTRFNFEISLDETEEATTARDHLFTANELAEHGVQLFSIAPKFVGGFEKAIDYKGSIQDFEKCLEEHCTIARYFKYKISVHAGSDKFSIYPSIGKISKGIFHIKTAGTSYLEALKIVALRNLNLYKEIHSLAVSTIVENMKTYHISPNLENAKLPKNVTPPKIIEELTNNGDWRQVLVVSYGPVLKTFGTKIKQILRTNEKTIMKQLQNTSKNTWQEQK